MPQATTTVSRASHPTAVVPTARPTGFRLVQPRLLRRLRAGVVGLGRQACDDHLPAVRASEMADLVAVCDPDPQRVGQACREFDVPGYRDVSDMFAGEELDFVVVAVPHSAGREVIVLAAEHGVHVLKEKPFATSLAEARELVGLCARSGIELMVTVQRRFDPIYSSFQQLYEQIGRPFLVDAVYTMSVNPAAGWRGQRRLAGGGCIIDMGYHMIDILLWYFGLPDRVLAQYSASARPELDYDAEDTAHLLLGFDSGLVGTVLLSRCVPPKTERIRVVGTRGMVVLERGRIQRFRSDGEILESLSRAQSCPGAVTTQVDHFCRVLHGSRPNLAGPNSHLAHAAFVEACYTSGQAGMFINPKELIA